VQKERQQLDGKKHFDTSIATKTSGRASKSFIDNLFDEAASEEADWSCISFETAPRSYLTKRLPKKPIGAASRSRLLQGDG
jgi:hypothetical protein